MTKSGTLRVGLGWVVASSSRCVASSTARSDAPAQAATRKLIEAFLDLLFTARCCRAAFVQCVDSGNFSGHLADGTYTALETAASLQAFVDTAGHLAVRSLVIDNDVAFARVERSYRDNSQPSQHLIQISVVGGRIVEYFGSLAD